MKIEKDKVNRGIALFMGLLMVATIFAAFPVANAYVENTDNDYLEITDTTLDDRIYHAGEGRVTFDVSVKNINKSEMSLYNATCTFNGETSTVVLNNHSIASGSTYIYRGFSIDIPETAGNHSATIVIEFNNRTDNDGHPNKIYNATLWFEVIPSTDLGDEVYVGDGSSVTDAMSPALYAGDQFKEISTPVRAIGGDISNVSLWVGLPSDSGIHWSNSDAGVWKSKFLGTINTTSPRIFSFRVDVDKDAKPGIYVGNYTIIYHNDTGYEATESGDINFIVDFIPSIKASVSNLTVAQGMNMVVFNITFNNSGNTMLYNVDVKISNASCEENLYLSPVFDFFEGTDVVYKEWVSLGNIAPGSSAHAYLKASLDRYIPAGQHKIMFDFFGYIYDDGATNRPSGYRAVVQTWNETHAPVWFYDNNENKKFDAGDEEIGINTAENMIDCTFVMLEVQDSSPDFGIMSAEEVSSSSSSPYTIAQSAAWNTITLSLDGSIVNREMKVKVVNREKIPFRDLSFRIFTGANSPFANAVNARDEWSEVYEVTSLAANGTKEITNTSTKALDMTEVIFFVSLRDGISPGVYLVPIQITGVNNYTMQDFSTQINTRVIIMGFGPEIVVSASTVGSIIPGGSFTMNITVENMGDDTARDLFVVIPPAVTQGPNGDWSILADFINMTGSDFEGNNISVENGNISDIADIYRSVSDDKIAMLQQLNISDAREIIDLDEYIASLYERPSAQIYILKAGSLAPGENITLSFTMMANSNMIKGKPYLVPIQLSYIDSFGIPHIPGTGLNGQDMGIVLKTDSAGAPYHGEANAPEHSGFLVIDSSNGGLILLFVLFLIFIVLIVGMGMNKDKGEKAKESKEPESEPELMEDEESPPDGEVDETPEEGQNLDIENMESAENFSLDMDEEAGESAEDASVEILEPGFSIDEEENMEPESDIEPGFTLDDKDEGESSF